MKFINSVTKDLIKEWIPPILLRKIRHVSGEIGFHNYPDKHLLSKNLELQNKGLGKRAFLLATGPSINEENLRILGGEDCFSLSNFFLHEEIQTINPLFHFMGFYHSPMILENYVEWLRYAHNRLPVGTQIVIGHTAADIVKTFDPFPGREIYYIYYGVGRYDKKIDLLRSVPSGQTGPLLLLPLLIYMGYQKIYLLGCDNTTIRNYKSYISNFYTPVQEMRKHATDPSIWGGIELEFHANLKCFEQYKSYEKMLRGTKTEIINLSVDSWVEAFPFQILKDLVFDRS